MIDSTMVWRAEDLGAEDAEVWLGETSAEHWEAAIAPGALGADEALVNALGRADALKLLGCLDARDESELLGAYSRGWAERVRVEIQDRSDAVLDGDVV